MYVDVGGGGCCTATGSCGTRTGCCGSCGGWDCEGADTGMGTMRVIGCLGKMLAGVMVARIGVRVCRGNGTTGKVMCGTLTVVLSKSVMSGSIWISSC